MNPATSQPVASGADQWSRYQDPTWGAELLKGINLFSRFAPEELAAIYRLGAVGRLKAQTSVVIEGESSRGLYIILDGTVSVYKGEPGSTTLTRLTLLETGANFGELTLFDDAPRSATVITEVDSVLFQLDATPFAAFLAAESSDLQIRFYKTCAEELAARFRQVNGDYLASQQLLWKYALRRAD